MRIEKDPITGRIRDVPEPSDLTPAPAPSIQPTTLFNGQGLGGVPSSSDFP